MSDPVLVAIIGGVFMALAPICTLIGVRVERRNKNTHAVAALQTSEAAQEQASAAKVEADAAKEEAEAAKRQADAALVAAAAEMRRAVTAEREQANADWARFVDAKDREIGRLSKAVDKNAQEILQAQMSIRAAEERARNWEDLFRRAKIYVEVLILFIRENVTDRDFPDPPPELELTI